MNYHFLFDYDGVLVEKTNFSKSVSERHGVNEAKVAWFFGTYLQDCLRGKADMIALFAQHLDEFNWDGNAQELFEAIYVENNQYKPEMIDFIRRRLKGKCPLNIATNQDQHRYEIVCQEPICQELFDQFFGSSEFGVAKPEIDYFTKIYAILTTQKPNLQKGEIVFIDDLEENVETAAKFGFIAHHYQNQSDFEYFIEQLIGANSSKQLSNERFSLVDMELSHAKGYSEILSEIDTYHFLTESGPVNEKDAAQKILSNQVSSKAGKSIYKSIISLAGEFMGFIAIHNFAGKKVAISYGIHPNYRRQGIGSAALKMILNWNELANKSVQLATHLENEASFQMLSKTDLLYLGIQELAMGKRHVFEK